MYHGSTGIGPRFTTWEMPGLRTVGHEGRPITNMPADSTIHFDVPCKKCKYNLRGLAFEGKCPECGVKTEDSLYTANPDAFWQFDEARRDADLTRYEQRVARSERHQDEVERQIKRQHQILDQQERIVARFERLLDSLERWLQSKHID
jgi:hypothetical protein